MKKIFLGVILLTTTFSPPVLGKDCESFECKLNGIKRKNHINTLKGPPVPEPTTALVGGIGCYLRKRK